MKNFATQPKRRPSQAKQDDQSSINLTAVPFLNCLNLSTLLSLKTLRHIQAQKNCAVTICRWLIGLLISISEDVLDAKFDAHT